MKVEESERLFWTLQLSQGSLLVPMSVGVEALSAPLGPLGLPVFAERLAGGTGSQGKDEGEEIPADSSLDGAGQAE